MKIKDKIQGVNNETIPFTNQDEGEIKEAVTLNNLDTADKIYNEIKHIDNPFTAVNTIVQRGSVSSSTNFLTSRNAIEINSNIGEPLGLPTTEVNMQGDWHIAPSVNFNSQSNSDHRSKFELNQQLEPEDVAQNSNLDVTSKFQVKPSITDFKLYSNSEIFTDLEKSLEFKPTTSNLQDNFSNQADSSFRISRDFIEPSTDFSKENNFKLLLQNINPVYGMSSTSFKYLINPNIDTTNVFTNEFAISKFNHDSFRGNPTRADFKIFDDLDTTTVPTIVNMNINFEKAREAHASDAENSEEYSISATNFDSDVTNTNFEYVLENENNVTIMPSRNYDSLKVDRSNDALPKILEYTGFDWPDDSTEEIGFVDPIIPLTDTDNDISSEDEDEAIRVSSEELTTIKGNQKLNHDQSSPTIDVNELSKLTNNYNSESATPITLLSKENLEKQEKFDNTSTSSEFSNSHVSVSTYTNSGFNKLPENLAQLANEGAKVNKNENSTITIISYSEDTNSIYENTASTFKLEDVKISSESFKISPVSEVNFVPSRSTEINSRIPGFSEFSGPVSSNFEFTHLPDISLNHSISTPPLQETTPLNGNSKDDFHVSLSAAQNYLKQKFANDMTPTELSNIARTITGSSSLEETFALTLTSEKATSDHQYKNVTDTELTNEQKAFVQTSETANSTTTLTPAINTPLSKDEFGDLQTSFEATSDHHHKKITDIELTNEQKVFVQSSETANSTTATTNTSLSRDEFGDIQTSFDGKTIIIRGTSSTPKNDDEEEDDLMVAFTSLLGEFVASEDEETTVALNVSAEYLTPIKHTEIDSTSHLVNLSHLTEATSTNNISHLTTSESTNKSDVSITITNEPVNIPANKSEGATEVSITATSEIIDYSELSKQITHSEEVTNSKLKEVDSSSIFPQAGTQGTSVPSSSNEVSLKPDNTTINKSEETTAVRMSQEQVSELATTSPIPQEQTITGILGHSEISKQISHSEEVTKLKVEEVSSSGISSQTGTQGTFESFQHEPGALPQSESTLKPDEIPTASTTVHEQTSITINKAEETTIVHVSQEQVNISTMVSSVEEVGSSGIFSQTSTRAASTSSQHEPGSLPQNEASLKLGQAAMVTVTAEELANITTNNTEQVKTPTPASSVPQEQATTTTNLKIEEASSSGIFSQTEIQGISASSQYSPGSIPQNESSLKTDEIAVANTTAHDQTNIIVNKTHSEEMVNLKTEEIGSSLTFTQTEVQAASVSPQHESESLLQNGASIKSNEVATAITTTKREELASTHVTQEPVSMPVTVPSAPQEQAIATAIDHSDISKQTTHSEEATNLKVEEVGSSVVLTQAEIQTSSVAFQHESESLPQNNTSIKSAEVSTTIITTTTPTAQEQTYIPTTVSPTLNEQAITAAVDHSEISKQITHSEEKTNLKIDEVGTQTSSLSPQHEPGSLSQNESVKPDETTAKITSTQEQISLTTSKSEDTSTHTVPEQTSIHAMVATIPQEQAITTATDYSELSKQTAHIKDVTNVIVEEVASSAMFSQTATLTAPLSSQHESGSISQSEVSLKLGETTIPSATAQEQVAIATTKSEETTYATPHEQVLSTDHTEISKQTTHSEEVTNLKVEEISSSVMFSQSSTQAASLSPQHESGSLKENEVSLKLGETTQEQVTIATTKSEEVTSVNMESGQAGIPATDSPTPQEQASSIDQISKPSTHLEEVTSLKVEEVSSSVTLSQSSTHPASLSSQHQSGSLPENEVSIKIGETTQEQVAIATTKPEEATSVHVSGQAGIPATDSPTPQEQASSTDQISKPTTHSEEVTNVKVEEVGSSIIVSQTGIHTSPVSPQYEPGPLSQNEASIKLDEAIIATTTSQEQITLASTKSENTISVHVTEEQGNIPTTISPSPQEQTITAAVEHSEISKQTTHSEVATNLKVEEAGSSIIFSTTEIQTSSVSPQHEPESLSQNEVSVKPDETTIASTTSQEQVTLASTKSENISVHVTEEQGSMPTIATPVPQEQAVTTAVDHSEISKQTMHSEEATNLKVEEVGSSAIYSRTGIQTTYVSPQHESGSTTQIEAIIKPDETTIAKTTSQEHTALATTKLENTSVHVTEEQGNISTTVSPVPQEQATTSAVDHSEISKQTMHSEEATNLKVEEVGSSVIFSQTGMSPVSLQHEPGSLSQNETILKPDETTIAKTTSQEQTALATTKLENTSVHVTEEQGNISTVSPVPQEQATTTAGDHSEISKQSMHSEEATNLKVEEVGSSVIFSQTGIQTTSVSPQHEPGSSTQNEAIIKPDETTIAKTTSQEQATLATTKLENTSVHVTEEQGNISTTVSPVPQEQATTTAVDHSEISKQTMHSEEATNLKVEEVGSSDIFSQTGIETSSVPPVSPQHEPGSLSQNETILKPDETTIAKSASQEETTLASTKSENTSIHMTEEQGNKSAIVSSVSLEQAVTAAVDHTEISKQTTHSEVATNFKVEEVGSSQISTTASSSHYENIVITSSQNPMTTEALKFNVSLTGSTFTSISMNNKEVTYSSSSYVVKTPLPTGLIGLSYSPSTVFTIPFLPPTIITTSISEIPMPVFPLTEPEIPSVTSIPLPLLHDSNLPIMNSITTMPQLLATPPNLNELEDITTEKASNIFIPISMNFLHTTDKNEEETDETMRHSLLKSSHKTSIDVEEATHHIHKTSVGKNERHKGVKTTSPSTKHSTEKKHMTHLQTTVKGNTEKHTGLFHLGHKSTTSSKDTKHTNNYDIHTDKEHQKSKEHKDKQMHIEHKGENKMKEHEHKEDEIKKEQEEDGVKEYQKEHEKSKSDKDNKTHEQKDEEHGTPKDEEHGIPKDETHEQENISAKYPKEEEGNILNEHFSEDKDHENPIDQKYEHTSSNKKDHHTKSHYTVVTEINEEVSAEITAKVTIEEITDHLIGTHKPRTSSVRNGFEIVESEPLETTIKHDGESSQIEETEEPSTTKPQEETEPETVIESSTEEFIAFEESTEENSAEEILTSTTNDEDEQLTEAETLSSLHDVINEHTGSKQNNFTTETPSMVEEEFDQNINLDADHITHHEEVQETEDKSYKTKHTTLTKTHEEINDAENIETTFGNPSVVHDKSSEEHSEISHIPEYTDYKNLGELKRTLASSTNQPNDIKHKTMDTYGPSIIEEVVTENLHLSQINNEEDAILTSPENNEENATFTSETEIKHTKYSVTESLSTIHEAFTNDLHMFSVKPGESGSSTTPTPIQEKHTLVSFEEVPSVSEEYTDMIHMTYESTAIQDKHTPISSEVPSSVSEENLDMFQTTHESTVVPEKHTATSQEAPGIIFEEHSDMFHITPEATPMQDKHTETTPEVPSSVSEEHLDMFDITQESTNVQEKHTNTSPEVPSSVSEEHLDMFHITHQLAPIQDKHTGTSPEMPASAPEGHSDIFDIVHETTLVHEKHTATSPIVPSSISEEHSNMFQITHTPTPVQEKHTAISPDEPLSVFEEHSNMFHLTNEPTHVPEKHTTAIKMPSSVSENYSDMLHLTHQSSAEHVDTIHTTVNSGHPPKEYEAKEITTGIQQDTPELICESCKTNNPAGMTVEYKTSATTKEHTIHSTKHSTTESKYQFEDHTDKKITSIKHSTSELICETCKTKESVGVTVEHKTKATTEETELSERTEKFLTSKKSTSYAHKNDQHKMHTGRITEKPDHEHKHQQTEVNNQPDQDKEEHNKTPEHESESETFHDKPSTHETEHHESVKPKEHTDSSEHEYSTKEEHYTQNEKEETSERNIGISTTITANDSIQEHKHVSVEFKEEDISSVSHSTSQEEIANEEHKEHTDSLKHEYLTTGHEENEEHATGPYEHNLVSQSHNDTSKEPTEENLEPTTKPHEYEIHTTTSEVHSYSTISHEHEEHAPTKSESGNHENKYEDNYFEENGHSTKSHIEHSTENREHHMTSHNYEENVTTPYNHEHEENNEHSILSLDHKNPTTFSEKHSETFHKSEENKHSSSSQEHEEHTTKFHEEEENSFSKMSEETTEHIHTTKLEEEHQTKFFEYESPTKETQEENSEHTTKPHEYEIHTTTSEVHTYSTISHEHEEHASTKSESGDHFTKTHENKYEENDFEENGHSTKSHIEHSTENREHHMKSHNYEENLTTPYDHEHEENNEYSMLSLDHKKPTTLSEKHSETFHKPEENEHSSSSQEHEEHSTKLHEEEEKSFSKMSEETTEHMHTTKLEEEHQTKFFEYESPIKETQELNENTQLSETQSEEHVTKVHSNANFKDELKEHKGHSSTLPDYTEEPTSHEYNELSYKFEDQTKLQHIDIHSTSEHIEGNRKSSEHYGTFTTEENVISQIDELLDIFSHSPNYDPFAISTEFDLLGTAVPNIYSENFEDHVESSSFELTTTNKRTTSLYSEGRETSKFGSVQNEEHVSFGGFNESNEVSLHAPQYTAINEEYISGKSRYTEKEHNTHFNTTITTSQEHEDMEQITNEFKNTTKSLEEKEHENESKQTSSYEYNEHHTSTSKHVHEYIGEHKEKTFLTYEHVSVQNTNKYENHKDQEGTSEQVPTEHETLSEHIYYETTSNNIKEQELEIKITEHETTLKDEHKEEDQELKEHETTSENEDLENKTGSRHLDEGHGDKITHKYQNTTLEYEHKEHQPSQHLEEQEHKDYGKYTSDHLHKTEEQMHEGTTEYGHKAYETTQRHEHENATIEHEPKEYEGERESTTFVHEALEYFGQTFKEHVTSLSEQKHIENKIGEEEHEGKTMESEHEKEHGDTTIKHEYTKHEHENKNKEHEHTEKEMDREYESTTFIHLYSTPKEHEISMSKQEHIENKIEEQEHGVTTTVRGNKYDHGNKEGEHEHKEHEEERVHESTTFIHGTSEYSEETPKHHEISISSHEHVGNKIGEQEYESTTVEREHKEHGTTQVHIEKQEHEGITVGHKEHEHENTEEKEGPKEHEGERVHEITTFIHETSEHSGQTLKTHEISVFEHEHIEHKEHEGEPEHGSTTFKFETSEHSEEMHKEHGITIPEHEHEANKIGEHEHEGTIVEHEHKEHNTTQVHVEEKEHEGIIMGHEHKEHEHDNTGEEHEHKEHEEELGHESVTVVHETSEHSGQTLEEHEISMSEFGHVEHKEHEGERKHESTTFKHEASEHSGEILKEHEITLSEHEHETNKIGEHEHEGTTVDHEHKEHNTTQIHVEEQEHEGIIMGHEHKENEHDKTGEKHEHKEHEEKLGHEGITVVHETSEHFGQTLEEHEISMSEYVNIEHKEHEEELKHESTTFKHEASEHSAEILKEHEITISEHEHEANKIGEQEHHSTTVEHEHEVHKTTQVHIEVHENTTFKHETSEHSGPTLKGHEISMSELEQVTNKNGEHEIEGTVVEHEHTEQYTTELHMEGHEHENITEKLEHKEHEGEREHESTTAVQEVSEFSSQTLKGHEISMSEHEHLEHKGHEGGREHESTTPKYETSEHSGEILTEHEITMSEHEYEMNKDVTFGSENGHENTGDNLDHKEHEGEREHESKPVIHETSEHPDQTLKAHEISMSDHEHAENQIKEHEGEYKEHEHKGNGGEQEHEEHQEERKHETTTLTNETSEHSGQALTEHETSMSDHEYTSNITGEEKHEVTTVEHEHKEHETTEFHMEGQEHEGITVGDEHKDDHKTQEHVEHEEDRAHESTTVLHETSELSGQTFKEPEISVSEHGHTENKIGEQEHEGTTKEHEYKEHEHENNVGEQDNREHEGERVHTSTTFKYEISEHSGQTLKENEINLSEHKHVVNKIGEQEHEGTTTEHGHNEHDVTEEHVEKQEHGGVIIEHEHKEYQQENNEAMQEHKEHEEEQEHKSTTFMHENSEHSEYKDHATTQMHKGEEDHEGVTVEHEHIAHEHEEHAHENNEKEHEHTDHEGEREYESTTFVHETSEHSESTLKEHEISISSPEHVENKIEEQEHESTTIEHEYKKHEHANTGGEYEHKEHEGERGHESTTEIEEQHQGITLEQEHTEHGHNNTGGEQVHNENQEHESTTFIHETSEHPEQTLKEHEISSSEHEHEHKIGEQEHEGTTIEQGLGVSDMEHKTTEHGLTTKHPEEFSHKEQEISALEHTTEHMTLEVSTLEANFNEHEHEHEGHEVSTPEHIKHTSVSNYVEQEHYVHTSEHELTTHNVTEQENASTTSEHEQNEHHISVQIEHLTHGISTAEHEHKTGLEHEGEEHREKVDHEQHKISTSDHEHNEEFYNSSSEHLESSHSTEHSEYSSKEEDNFSHSTHENKENEHSSSEHEDESLNKGKGDHREHEEHKTTTLEYKDVEYKSKEHEEPEGKTTKHKEHEHQQTSKQYETTSLENHDNEGYTTKEEHEKQEHVTSEHKGKYTPLCSKEHEHNTTNSEVHEGTSTILESHHKEQTSKGHEEHATEQEDHTTATEHEEHAPISEEATVYLYSMEPEHNEPISATNTWRNGERLGVIDRIKTDETKATTTTTEISVTNYVTTEENIISSKKTQGCLTPKSTSTTTTTIRTTTTHAPKKCMFTPVTDGKLCETTKKSSEVSAVPSIREIHIDLPTYYQNSTVPVPSFEKYYTTEKHSHVLIDDENADITLNPNDFRSMKLLDFDIITEFQTTNVNSSISSITVTGKMTGTGRDERTVMTAVTSTGVNRSTTENETDTEINHLDNALSKECMSSSKHIIFESLCSKETSKPLCSNEHSKPNESLCSDENTTITGSLSSNDNTTTSRSLSSNNHTTITQSMSSAHYETPTGNVSSSDHRSTIGSISTNKYTSTSTNPSSNENLSASTINPGNSSITLNVSKITPSGVSPCKFGNKSGKKCICSIDSLVKDLQEKSMNKMLNATTSSYICDMYVPSKNGLSLSEKPHRRRKRSATFGLGREDISRKREVIHNLDIATALAKYSGFSDSDNHQYVIPGSNVRIPCAEGKNISQNNYSIKWTTQDGLPITEGKMLETKSGYLVIDNVVPQDGGNYTCTISSNSTGMRTFKHQLSIIMLPMFDVNTSLLYHMSDHCMMEDTEVVKMYFNVDIGNVICGKEHRVCRIDIKNARCFNKKDKNYLYISLVYHMEPLTDIVPTLNTTQCDIWCQLKIYAKLISVVVNNLQVFETQPVIYNQKREVTLTPTNENVTSNETMEYPKLLIGCPAGFGLMDDRQICIACGPNSYSNGDESYCSACPKKEYQPSVGSKSCLACTSPLQDPNCLSVMIMDGSKFKILVYSASVFVVLVAIGTVIMHCRKSRHSDAKKRRNNVKDYSKSRKSRHNTDVEKQELRESRKGKKRRKHTPPSPPPPDF